VRTGQKTFRARCSRCARPSLAATPTSPRHLRGERPLRAELFSREQMAQHGKVLAGLHRLSTGVLRISC